MRRCCDSNPAKPYTQQRASLNSEALCLARLLATPFTTSNEYTGNEYTGKYTGNGNE